MLEEMQKIRLLTAAVNMRNIISTLEIDLEYQTLIDLYGSRTKTLLDEVQALEDANAEPRVAGDFTLQSQLDDSGDLFTSLNHTIYQLDKLIVQINNNQNLTGIMQSCSETD
ncbi:MAG: hypothetical protein ACERLB_10550 [Gammaproteobacteria bacterium]